MNQSEKDRCHMISHIFITKSKRQMKQNSYIQRRDWWLPAAGGYG